MLETNWHDTRPAASAKKIKVVTGMPSGLNPDWRESIIPQAIKAVLAHVANETPSVDNPQEKSNLHEAAAGVEQAHSSTTESESDLEANVGEQTSRPMVKVK